MRCVPARSTLSTAFRCFTSFLGMTGGVVLLAAVGVTCAKLRHQAFKPADAALEAVRGKAADPDGDGLSHFAKHAIGPDPRRRDADRGPRWRREDGALALAFDLATAPRDARVRLEHAGDLVMADWLGFSG